MSKVQVMSQTLAPYIDVVKVLFSAPRTLLLSIDDDRAQWRLSLHLLAAAVVCNAVLETLIQQDLALGALALIHLPLLALFYTAVLHLFATWLLQTPVPWLRTNTALNYAMVTAIFVPIPYVSVVAMGYFFFLIFLILQDLYGAVRNRALVSLSLFVMAALVFAAAAARLGLVNP
ncbi:MAG: hypothetical protein WC012_09385 [Thiohalomonadaceae bacterium]